MSLRNHNKRINTIDDIVTATDDVFSSLGSREIDIASQRWGTGKYMYYEEIGKNYNLTRERIRQLSARIKRNFIKRNKSHFDEWRRLFLDILTDKPEPITIDFVNNYNPKHSPYLYLGLFSEIFKEIPFKNFFPKSFEQLIKRKTSTNLIWQKITGLLNNYQLPIGETTPQNLRIILSNNGFNIIEQLLCFKIILGSKKFFFFKEESKYFLLRRGGIRETTFSILSSSEIPLDITALMGKIHKYYGYDSKYDSLISVIGNLKQDERLVQFDRYTFGVEKHFSYSKETWSSICSIAKKFLQTMKRQCYVTEILEKAKKDYPLLKSKYELVNILRNDKEIIDLGFFTFSVFETGIKSRIKLKDLILKIYKDNPRIRHYTEIKNEILNIRHVRAEGLNVLLKNINEIIKYPCSFYGLKDLDQDSMTYLSKHHQFIRSYISSDIYPDTKISKLLEFFVEDTNKNNCLLSIQRSKELKVIDSLTGTEPFVVSINWNLIKLVKCILFHYRKPMYLTEMKWILNDLGITNEMFNENKHRIIEDKQIIKKNQTLEYFDYDINIHRNNDLIETFYELLLDTRTTFAFQDFVAEFNDDLTQEGLDEKKLRAILDEDERFIITDELIMVKSS